MEQITLKYDLISTIKNIDLDTTNTFVDIIESKVLAEIQIEKNQIKKILDIASILSRVVDSSTEYYYWNVPRRSETELVGGYKLALKRGARVNQTKIINLSFHFKSKMVNATGIAAMYKTQNNDEEWIVMLPDNTTTRIDAERKTYLDVARELVFIKGIMTSEEQNILIENLNELTVNERCAQSIMHEYGHVLHWREFYRLNFSINEYELYIEQLYTWFFESGYLSNVDKRVVNFATYDTYRQTELLKESLAEDYRISLNLKDKGKYILPNSVCHQGDFVNPRIMEEGIEIMQSMLTDMEEVNSRNVFVDAEQDRIKLAKEMLERQNRYKWSLGSSSISESDFKIRINELRERRNAYKEVACSKEEDDKK